jgi:tRNA-dihydrouridine synthase C
MESWLVKKRRPGLILAPMEGVTDAPMRSLLTEKGDYLFCVSEFLRVSHQVIPQSVFKRHVPELTQNSRTPSGTPVVVQLLGGDPHRLALSAIKAVELGAAGIDLNFGCPAPTVNRHDGGATLLKFPKRLFEIVSEVRRAVPSHISVSAKLRLGWENPDDIFHNVMEVAKAGASWVTLHARTRMQGYAKPIFWEHIGRVTQLVDIPVVANGDIWNLNDFKRCRDITGCEHFMLGRGAVGNPWLAQQIRALLLETSSEEPIDATPFSPQQWSPLIKRFVELSASHTFKEEYPVRRIKQWIKLATMERELPWFDSLKKTQSLAECMKIFEAPSL